MKIFSYDIIMGWEEIDDFIYVDDSAGDFNTGLSLSGYSPYNCGKIGDDDSFFQIEVYVKKDSEKPYQFIVSTDVRAYCETIAVTNFPSLVELLAKLSTINHAASYSENTINNA